ncbi:MAG: adenosine deaminase family protein [Kiritimatiellae bacterium]|jgi:adenosine deaminase|nr:adenosine deaminase family protein [Kiritimatiellia bacterium]
MSTVAELIKSVPKSELHSHLDGSMRASTLIELAREQGVELPSYDVAGLNECVFKDQYSSLSEYLLGFGYTCAVLGDFEAIERTAFEMATDAILDGVRYMEVRFSPQLLVSSSAECVTAFRAVNAGLMQAATTFNQSRDVSCGAKIPFEYGIICCAMRNFFRGMGVYFDTLLDVLSATKKRDIINIASMEAVRSALTARDNFGVPVVAFDLAGEEDGYPAGHHYSAYDEAHANFMRTTVHAGEAYGPESIYEAVTKCHAERIGHGTSIFDSGRIIDPLITDKEAYVDALANYVATMRITVEVCPTSNMQTIPDLKGNMDNHPVRKMLDYGMSVAICTDNTLVSHTSLSNELTLTAEACHLEKEQLKRLVLAGFKGAFYHGSYAQKRAFVKRAADEIDEIFNS